LDEKTARKIQSISEEARSRYPGLPVVIGAAERSIHKRFLKSTIRKFLPTRQISTSTSLLGYDFHPNTRK
jgi:hypothetical protein